jgi:hypothetical protein
MEVQLDHLLVPSRDKNGAAKLLAKILGVRWDPCGKEPATPPTETAHPAVSDISEEQWRHYRARRASVYINDSLTIDFVEPQFLGAEDNRVPVHHYCFRVSDAEFDTILERVNQIGLKYSSAQKLREPDCKIYTLLGGKGFYFTEPDGHSWEVLTVSYARPTE